MSERIKIQKNITSFQIIILGFIGVILAGAIILMLPVSSKSGTFTPFDKTLFTATSAVCVTGLAVVDTASYWSYFGQAVILLLIQVGGLGVVTVALFFSIIVGKKISLKERATMQSAMSLPHVGGMVRLTRFIFITTFIVESIGAIFLVPFFYPKYGLKGIWMSVFHSISAFCNAGFDLMGESEGQFSSLTFAASSPYLSVVIAALIIVGGLGFFTWSDVTSKRTNFKEYQMQTKMILITTAVLIVVPMLCFFIFEFNEGALTERVCKAFFQAVTPRTAGFNTADISLMSDRGRIIIMMLMLIGGAPGSTAGGVKTTTAALLFANIIAVFKKKQNVNCFGRRIEDSVVKNASAIVLMYVVMAFTAAVLISMRENLSMSLCLFETVSAIGTVGLTLGITPELSVFSHMILIILMFMGRVGGLTLVYAALSNKETVSLKYPEGNIMIG
ncbi:MAG: Trk family potassium uptake protein [Lachnospiraceae bacterium]|nr:Trk family potassium uptake protein [Lachnospiraceae bacterium]